MYSLFIIRATILQELNLKSGSEIYEFLTWMGLISFLITTIELYFIELNTLIEVNFCVSSICLILCAALCLLFFSIIVPFYIKRCSAALFNISQVSQIFWSSLINFIVFQEQVTIHIY